MGWEMCFLQRMGGITVCGCVNYANIKVCKQKSKMQKSNDIFSGVLYFLSFHVIPFVIPLRFSVVPTSRSDFSKIKPQSKNPNHWAPRKIRILSIPGLRSGLHSLPGALSYLKKTNFRAILSFLRPCAGITRKNTVGGE